MCDIICRMIEDKKNWDNVEQKKKFQRLAVHMRRHLPPREWMLGILSHIQPNNVIFVKGYRYLPPKDEQIKLVEPTIPNRNGFFDNLP